MIELSFSVGVTDANDLLMQPLCMTWQLAYMFCDEHNGTFAFCTVMAFCFTFLFSSIALKDKTQFSAQRNQRERSALLILD